MARSEDTSNEDDEERNLFDARWEELAQGFADALPPPLRDWAGGAVHPATPPTGEPNPTRSPPADQPQQTPPPESAGPRDWTPAEAPEPHFEPPEAPPIFAAQPILVVGWLGLLGGIGIVLAWAILGGLIPMWLVRTGAVGLVLGIVILIWRMPHERDPDDFSDGAQV